MAKRRVSKKQRAAARRNIKKAQAARKRMSHHAKETPRRHKRGTPRRHKRRSHASAAESPRRRRKRHHVAEASRGKAKKAKKGKRAKAAKKHKKYTYYTRKEYTNSKGVHFPKRRIRKRHKKHDVKSYSYTRKRDGKMVHVKAHRSYEHRSRRSRNPIPNPIASPMDFVGAMLAIGAGILIASGADRFVASHALAASSGQGGPTDSPAAGQLYNVESVQAPIWSNWKRLAAAGGAIALPGVLSLVLKGKMKSAFEYITLGAVGRTLGKSLDDASAKMLGNTSVGVRLFAPEVQAQVDYAKVAAQGAAPLNPRTPILAGIAGRPLGTVDVPGTVNQSGGYVQKQPPYQVNPGGYTPPGLPEGGNHVIPTPEPKFVPPAPPAGPPIPLSPPQFVPSPPQASGGDGGGGGGGDGGGGGGGGGGASGDSSGGSCPSCGDYCGGSCKSGGCSNFNPLTAGQDLGSPAESDY